MRDAFTAGVIWALAVWILGLVVAGGCAQPAAAVGSPGPATAPTKPADRKIPVTKADDLPQHTYPFHGRLTELVRSKSGIAELAEKVRADVQADLDTYDIQDASTLQRLYGTLLTVDLIAGRYDDALARIEQIRALEDKPAKRLMIGTVARALIAARREAKPADDFAAYKAAFRRHFADAVLKLPWDVVQDEVQQKKGRLEIIGENLLLGVLDAQMQPAVDRTGELNADAAASVLGIHWMLDGQLPLKEEMLAVYGEMIAAHQEAKPDIWAERAVRLYEHPDCRPVLMAVWDSGTDPAVFRDILWTNLKETRDGQDNDGNGYVDDIHGIAYDIHARRTTGLLCPLGDAADRIAEVMQHLKGLMDLQAAIDSPEATALKRHLAALPPQEMKRFMEDLGLAGNYAHGTHVAGIMVDGNPYARLLIARLSYDHHLIPVARTPEWGRRDAAKCRDTVAYFKRYGVRVVNMSWGERLEDAESSLEKNGIGASAEERRQIAREVFGYQKEGLYDAIRGAPQILFVCAAGNADNDVQFDEDIPSSFDLPNLLVVGAVDQAGEPTSFTSFGPTVQVYANGFEVESYVPGGARMKMSGTSMAAPNVANLAGKLLALDPSLTPHQIIYLIKRGADEKEFGAHKYLLINPRRTVQIAKQRMKT